MNLAANRRARRLVHATFVRLLEQSRFTRDATCRHLQCRTGGARTTTNKPAIRLRPKLVEVTAKTHSVLQQQMHLQQQHPRVLKVFAVATQLTNVVALTRRSKTDCNWPLRHVKKRSDSEGAFEPVVANKSELQSARDVTSSPNCVGLVPSCTRNWTLSSDGSK
jgi:hypothetical protein